jgi:hypothetical protein
MDNVGAEQGAGTSTTEDERRIARRFAAKDLPGLGMKLSTGGDVRLLDFSQSGARFECDRRLLPGSTVALAFMTTDTPVVVRGRVVRARLTRLTSGGLGYEVAVAFERLLEINPEALASATPAASSRKPAQATPLPADAPVSVFAAAAAAVDAIAPPQPAVLVPATGGSPAEDANFDDVPELLVLTATVQRSRNDLWQVFNGNDW